MFPHLIGNPESANSIIRNAFTHFLPDHKPHNSPDRHRTIYKHVLEGMVKKGHSPYLSQFAVKKLAKFAEVCPKRIINWFVSGRHELKNRIRFGFRPLGLRAKRSETDSVVIKLLDEGVRLYGSDVEKLYRFGIPDEEKITRSGEEVAPFMKVLVYVYHKLTSIDKNAMIGRSEAMLLSKTLDLSGPEKVEETYMFGAKQNGGWLLLKPATFVFGMIEKHSNPKANLQQWPTTTATSTTPSNFDARLCERCSKPKRKRNHWSVEPKRQRWSETKMVAAATIINKYNEKFEVNKLLMKRSTDNGFIDERHFLRVMAKNEIKTTCSRK
ncbi:hypothetical protein L5515_005002 [Caenorhabditis briggsae]|uniref:Uncharacterized protein n=1 Tax=Caenorhabditis briggsae TaxID=6238 RepID=A0AAE9JEA4_CAEBR|nr:hypothetical protein L5515_005002 [Caenorhabditis briggsae]